MCPEQSTPLITARSGLTSNSLIISTREEAQVCDELALQSDYQVQIKICPLWLCCASKMLHRLKYCNMGLQVTSLTHVYTEFLVETM